ncbi:hypothetical protein BT69DRAFT_1235983 [Atractiella rhizophila]|nr:hypothetical protein BT69DRAFT_1235983 [Atractiella rhizophila]
MADLSLPISTPPRMTPSPVPSASSISSTNSNVTRSRVLAAKAAFESGNVNGANADKKESERRKDLLKLEEGRRVSMNREEIMRLGENANAERLQRLSTIDLPAFSYTSPTSPLSPSRHASRRSSLSSSLSFAPPESPLLSKSPVDLTSEPEEILSPSLTSPSLATGSLTSKNLASVAGLPPKSPLRGLREQSPATEPASTSTHTNTNGAGHHRSQTTETIIAPPTGIGIGEREGGGGYKHKKKASVSDLSFPSSGASGGGEKTPTLQPSTPVATAHNLKASRSSKEKERSDTSSIPIPPIPDDPPLLGTGSRTPRTSTSSIGGAAAVRPPKSPKRSLTARSGASASIASKASLEREREREMQMEKDRHDFTPGDEREWMSRVGGLLGLNGLNLSSPPSAEAQRRSVLARSGSVMSKGGGGGGGHGGRAEERERERENEEIRLLAVSAAMTELSMSVGEIQILIFEIQEMRHATSNKEDLDYADITSISPILAPTPHRTPSRKNRPSTGPQAEETNSDVSALPGSIPASPLKPTSSSASYPGMGGEETAGSGKGTVDDALMRLDERLDAVALEFQALEERVSPLLASEGGGEEKEFVRKKRAALLREWENAQKDAETLTEELREDRWLTVFRTVGQQAEEMMGSLEKVVEQCRGVRVRNFKGSKNIFLDRDKQEGGDWKKEVEGFVGLNKNFRLKKKFYTPSCDRVLKILEKGIKERSTRNGEVLRRFADMKARWKALGERMERIERDLDTVEAMAVEACRVKKDKVEGLDMTVKEKEDKKSSTSSHTPSAKSSSLLSAPGTPAGKPGPLSRTVSPFRRLANKLSSSSRSRTPPVPPSPTTVPQRSISRQSETVKIRRPSFGTGAGTGTTNPSPLSTPVRNGTATMRKMPSSGDLAGMRRRPPSSQATHKHSNSVTGVSTSSGNPLISRPRSPVGAGGSVYTPPSLEGKPRWNISTKRDPKAWEYDFQETLSTREKGRPTLPTSFGSRSRTASPAPPSGFNGRTSRAGATTPSLAPPTPGKRAPSPAFSNVSAGGTQIRARPQSPSLIPAPAKNSPGRDMLRSSTPFSSLEDDEPTSLLQRAMSPTPSQFSNSVISSAYRPSSRLSNAAGSKIPQLSFSPPSSSNLARAQTPESSMLARAQRIAQVYQTPANRSLNPVTSDYENVGKTPPVSSRKQLAKAMSTSSAASSTLSHNTSQTSPPASKRSSPPLYASPSLTAPPYEPNRHDPLDVEIAKIVNSQTLRIKVERVDPKLNRNVDVNLTGGLMARYTFGEPGSQPGKPVMVKVVERGKGGLRKVMVRVGGGWMDLELYLLSRQAAFAS